MINWAMKNNTVCGAVFICLISTTVSAAESKEVFKAGKWSVMQSIDDMTDKKVCTAIYQKKWLVQATASSFYVSYKGRGGIEGYQLRFDEHSAEEYQAASKTERALGTIVFDSDYFTKANQAKRVRIRTSTLISGGISEDIDITDLKPVVEYMKDHGC